MTDISQSRPSRKFDEKLERDQEKENEAASEANIRAVYSMGDHSSLRRDVYFLVASPAVYLASSSYPDGWTKRS